MEANPRYRAPQNDGEVVVKPTAAQLATKLAEWKPDTADGEVFGRPLPDFISAARRESLQAAIGYTRSYCDPAFNDLGGPVVFTGHQPEIIHPGVWMKNFLAAGLAKHVGGVAVNLIIDGDQCVRPAIRVPTGTRDQPRVEVVAFDQAARPTPYEARMISDRSMWQSFGRRVQQHLRPLVSEPFIESWWPQVVARDAEDPLLGRCLAQARHQCELAWGSETLELPQSLMCQTPSFRWFAVQLLADLPRFRVAYNQALAEYRAAHRIRNAAQPLPDLIVRDGWLEAPLWIWQSDAADRRPLFVRRRGDTMELSNFAGVEIELPVADSQLAGDACEKLALYEAQGIKLRSRALLTTMFARLALSDLFIHGIGGGKYDQATDEMTRRYFKSALPAFAVATGTLRLGVEKPTTDFGRPQEIRTHLREMEYHPERWIDFDRVNSVELAEIEAAKKMKYRAINARNDSQSASDRHAQIVAANAQLRFFLRGKQQTLQASLDAAERTVRARTILDSREYAFCLFSRERLQAFFMGVHRTSLSAASGVG